MTQPLNNPHGAVKGRGAAGNPPNRFEELRYDIDPEWIDEDGWDLSAPGRPPTRYFRDASRSIIAYNTSPDIPFEASINVYRGCEHGCIYCYARPYHEYLGLSAGLDFETQIFVKTAAPRLLRKELAARKWKPQPLAMSGITDPYQPIERKLKLTRQCLEVCLEFRNPVLLISKNRLMTRDVDVLTEMAKMRLVSTAITLTTLDRALHRVLEPRTPPPDTRLRAIETLAAAGVPVRVMTAPLIPGLNDHELPRLLKAAAEAGACAAGYTVLRLPYAVAPLFARWLDDHFPDRKAKVLNKLSKVRGTIYKSEFGTRMTGEGKYADQIKDMYTVYSKKYGLTGGPGVTTEHFRKPSGAQMSLLDR